MNDAITPLAKYRFLSTGAMSTLLVIGSLGRALAHPADSPRASTNAAVTIKIGAGQRELRFSGLDWSIKSSADTRVGPGPNYFGPTNAWVDGKGRLHLKLSRQDGRWYGAEIISKRSFGLGTYRFYLDFALDRIDPRVVVGLFTWSNERAFHHREIDIEFARWNNGDDTNNAQFVVQPYRPAGRLMRFRIPPNLETSTHSFLWQSERVEFCSLRGHTRGPAPLETVISQWTFSGANVPQPGGENVRLNLWLFEGKAPSDGQELEVIFSKFEFQPWPSEK
jgi:hypothetical protein